LRARRQAEEALVQAKNDWEQEKVRLVGDVVKLRRSGTGTPAKPSKSGADDDRVDQLERQLDDAIKSRDKQLREAASAKEKLERELEKARQALAGAANESPKEDIARLKSDLEQARAEATLASRRVEDEKAAMDKKCTSLESQLRQIISAKNNLERELGKARQEILRRGAENVEENDGDDSVSAEVVEQLRRQYDERMQEMIHQKTQLSDELRSVTSLLEEERHKLSANGTTGHKPAGMDPDAIDEEVNRIQDMIAGIAKLIDNPETELSTVIRKNVERAELDAYLRGILFSMGRGPGLESY